MSVGDQSRFNYAVRVRVVGSTGALVERDHLDLRPRLQQTVHTDNTIYAVRGADRWSQIAWRMLGQGQYWWIIADYSNVIDPLSALHPRVVENYRTQLSVDLPAGEQHAATLRHPKLVARGMKLRITDLDIAGAGNQVELTPLSVNLTTGQMTFAPVTVPAGGIPALLSRVASLDSDPAALVVPAAQRALFQALDFGNPFNTLVA